METTISIAILITKDDIPSISNNTTLWHSTYVFCFCMNQYVQYPFQCLVSDNFFLANSTTYSNNVFYLCFPWLMSFAVFSSWCNFSPRAPGNCFLSLWILPEALLREMSSDLRPNQIVWSQKEGLVEMASNIAWWSLMTVLMHCLINTLRLRQNGSHFFSDDV